MDSPWDDDVDFNTVSEWSKISNDFTNNGYREGITEGKESALQEGFDSGFAQIGVPLGQELGLMRGVASALVAFLTGASASEEDAVVSEAREIASLLSNIRFTDIVPRDLEAEAHARQHLGAADDDDAMDENEELAEKRKVEQLEDMLSQLTADKSTGLNQPGRPTAADLAALQGRLDALCQKLNLGLNF
ncbi:hypothetical protein FIBSPDRAFT_909248 [Athelia psychrophila]|uniref:Protein YAE1 n=1 Tax=Athelia psychrophila TaxID=1759441 RepID=A0A166PNB8_9AGAM|nr:hypothetical protein FIBSPDRAFT_909248 [Fibularhizoctonia sp. CBS 109695]